MGFVNFTLVCSLSMPEVWLKYAGSMREVWI